MALMNNKAAYVFMVLNCVWFHTISRGFCLWVTLWNQKKRCLLFLSLYVHYEFQIKTNATLIYCLWRKNAATLHACVYAATQNVGSRDFWLPTLQLAHVVVLSIFVHNVSNLDLDLLARMFNNQLEISFSNSRKCFWFIKLHLYLFIHWSVYLFIYLVII